MYLGKQYNNPNDTLLQERCKREGLWNLAFSRDSPGGKYGAGLTNVEYAFICEEIGKCPNTAPGVSFVFITCTHVHKTEYLRKIAPIESK